MSRKAVPLAPEHLAALAPVLAEELEHAGTAAPCDLDWVETVTREWGRCGTAVLVDGEPRGMALHAPAAYVPGSGSHPTAPASPDAVLLAGVYVVPVARGGGLGRLLVQGVCRDLTERHLTALEAFGDTRGHARPGSTSVLPVEFLQAVGFGVLRAHSTTPRLRLDLRTAVSWRGEVEQALGRLAGIVRPGHRPVPAPERVTRG